MSTNLRRLKHENVTAKFDANRGAEGQIKARKNAKGEVELVAFFGGKWFYCPMAELNKTLNLRHGAQVDGSDIMTASQKDSSGFTNVRINPTNTEISPKLYEGRIFIDIVPATPDGGSAITKAFNLTDGSKDAAAPSNGANASIISGLNVTGTGIDSDTFITVSAAGDPSNPMAIKLSRPATSNQTPSTLTFKTRETDEQNAFLNIIYKDSDDTYYHKFQLNTTTLTPFGGEEQPTQAGAVAGAGGSGTARGLL